ncbi:hypothetical protein T06_5697 [Trichinella sp. T6]|nr:hypothetical protein T06_5697 [Trichinella sp. T6]
MKKIKKKIFSISQLCTITSEPFNDFHLILVGKNFDHASKLRRTSYFIGTIATYQICQFFNTASKLLQKDVDVDAALPVEHVDFHSFFVTTFKVMDAISEKDHLNISLKYKLNLEVMDAISKKDHLDSPFH